MDPELVFNFRADNVEKIRSLLHTLKPDTSTLGPSGESRNNHLFDIMAVSVNEGLQFAQIIPNAKTAHLENIAKNLKYYEKLKRRFENLYNLFNNGK